MTGDLRELAVDGALFSGWTARRAVAGAAKLITTQGCSTRPEFGFIYCVVGKPKK
jgi:hypothetical protein